MTETHGETTRIKCSKCKCQYINDDEHIKNDFGYSRLGKRYKTCAKCRARTKEKQQSHQQTIIKPLNKPNETSAPTPLFRGGFKLNINTLSAETFTIEMYRTEKEDECTEWCCTMTKIKARIACHYEYKIIDKFIADSNVILPRSYWKYGTRGDGYLCGATDDIINEIKQYKPEHQQLIHNNKILEQEDIINETVRLNNNDCITVVFTS